MGNALQSSPLFRYFIEANNENAHPLRIFAVHAQQYVDDKLEDGTAKYRETTFKDFWDNQSEEARVAALKDADSGEFWAELQDPETNEYATVALSVLTGEPVQVPAEDAPADDVQPEEVTEPTSDVPAEETVPESTETAADAPAGETSAQETTEPAVEPSTDEAPAEQVAASEPEVAPDSTPSEEVAS